MGPTRLGRGLAVVLLATLVGGCTATAHLDLPAAAPSTRKGGVLKVALGKPSSIDPQNAFEPAGQTVVAAMCDPLIAVDPTTGELKSSILESWSVTKRGSQLNLRIRKGAHFSNGATVTADDVRFSLTRIASAEYASFVSGLMRPVKGFPFVHGDQKTEDDVKLRNLEGVHVLESRSLEIELTSPNADWIRVLTHPASSPVPRKLAQHNVDAFAANPVCVGPYRLLRPWRGQDTLTLVRNQHYDAKNGAYTAGGLGYPDRIEVHIKPSLAAQADAYATGEVDVAEIPPDRLAAARQSSSSAVVEVPAPGIDYIGFPDGRIQLGHPLVRRALSAALDRQRLVNEVFAGARQPATGYLPPALGRTEVRAQGCPELKPTADVNEARRLLTEAKVDLTGSHVKMHFNDELGNRQLVEAVARQWHDALGLDFDLVPSSWEAFATAGTGPDGFDGGFRFSWTPSYLSADQYLAPLFGSEGVGQDNYSRWADPAFDRILERNARAGAEDVDRRVEYRRLEDIACRAMPLIPIDFDQDQYLVRPEAVGTATKSFVSSGLGGLTWRELYLRRAS
jgi:ABC-type oligopeptide transport system substrate-binding subunit